MTDVKGLVLFALRETQTFSFVRRTTMIRVMRNKHIWYSQ